MPAHPVRQSVALRSQADCGLVDDTRGFAEAGAAIASAGMIVINEIAVLKFIATSILKAAGPSAPRRATLD